MDSGFFPGPARRSFSSTHDEGVVSHFKASEEKKKKFQWASMSLFCWVMATDKMTFVPSISFKNNQGMTCGVLKGHSFL